MIQHIFISAAEEAANQNVLFTLGINWKLFIAQLINFSIVLFAVSFITKGLAKVMKERQAKIESGLKNADAMEKEKAEFDTWKKEEMHKARVEAESIVKNATDLAEKAKSEILVTAHAEAGRLIEQTKASLAAEKETTMREIKQEVATLIVAASEKILRSKVDEKKDHELIVSSMKEAK